MLCCLLGKVTTTTATAKLTTAERHERQSKRFCMKDLKNLSLYASKRLGRSSLLSSFEARSVFKLNHHFVFLEILAPYLIFIELKTLWCIPDKLP